ncbi:MAG: 2-amino-4-hydroxy-6-hydroxymethyldihydropteridine diphosphokinase [Bacteroidia bacterium]|nr:2-amino-4-hydroxy-6-hydroxymethyldihydropteridine diphosphokinase [Bacteroidia bacterium]MDW8133949.1 2-amino-4-hydroxy-6-hydroxymethyldihydropteridine diphosphokinase [Bacteroidia bacterium]
MIFIGVGTNLGDRWQALLQAWRYLQESQVEVVRSSPVYETLPWGRVDQPLYLNAVWEVSTDFSPEELLKVLQSVERRLGRPETLRPHWGARVIDLDLLAYGEEVRNTSFLILPHPWIPYRAFVLGPWKDIAPYFYLRRWQATVGELWERCSFSGWGWVANSPPSVLFPPLRPALILPLGRVI